MFKTIVVHVSPSSGMPAVFDTAACLARTYGAHLVGTAVSGVAEINRPTAFTAGTAIPAYDHEAMRKMAQQRLGAFLRQCQAASVPSCETRLFDMAATEALILQSRYCDLLVAGNQDVAEPAMPAWPHLPGRLVTQCVRPVLLVPPEHKAKDHFSKIMIAWNGSAGASRAIAFALPLLQRAALLTIIVCNPADEQIYMGVEPGCDLATYLARHHSNVQVVRLKSRNGTAAALCEFAQHKHCDLVVAGAYGHGRLHDWVVGSTTGNLIKECQVPLLMTQ